VALLRAAMRHLRGDDMKKKNTSINYASVSTTLALMSDRLSPETLAKLADAQLMTANAYKVWIDAHFYLERTQRSIVKAVLEEPNDQESHVGNLPATMKLRGKILTWAGEQPGAVFDGRILKRKLVAFANHTQVSKELGNMVSEGILVRVQRKGGKESYRIR